MEILTNEQKKSLDDHAAKIAAYMVQKEIEQAFVYFLEAHLGDLEDSLLDELPLNTQEYPAA